MTAAADDEAFVRHLNELGFATLDQIDEARRVQAATQNKLASLSAILVKQGVVTAQQKETIEKKLAAEQAEPKRFGQFKLVRKLGEGGMGTVFLAEDEMAGRKVALKILAKRYAQDAEFLARFRREARAAGKLNHVNIVPAYSVHEEAGTHFYAMEYCQGEPLGARLQREKFLPWKTALEIVMQVARGLNYAHEHGILHRDIKPDNIFLADGPELTAKILDLGLSKDISDNEQSFHTQTGMTMGTPHYISPEQARGEKDIDGRTDLYSLGATLYHLLTGEPPFGSGTASMIIVRHITEQIPNPQDIRPEIPDAVVHVVQKMMGKLPEDRHANCAELIEDLELVLSDRPPSTARLPADRSSIANRGATLKGRARQERERALKKQTLLLALTGGVAGILLIALALWMFKAKPTVSAARASDPVPNKIPEEKPDTSTPPKGLATVNTNLTPPPPPLPPTTSEDPWIAKIQAEPAEDQLKDVILELKKLNPNFDGAEKHVIENGAVIELVLRAETLLNISPVRALTKLQRLNCSGHDHSWSNTPKFFDLSPLKNLKLTWVRCSFTQVRDLSPLREMPLLYLNLWGTEADLNTLKNHKTLREIECQFQPARDTEALKSIPTLVRINARSLSDFWKQFENPAQK